MDGTPRRDYEAQYDLTVGHLARAKLREKGLENNEVNFRAECDEIVARWVRNSKRPDHRRRRRPRWLKKRGKK